MPLKASQTYKALWKHIALIKCLKSSLRAFERLWGAFLVANSPVLHNRNNEHLIDCLSVAINLNVLTLFPFIRFYEDKITDWMKSSSSSDKPMIFVFSIFFNSCLAIFNCSLFSSLIELSSLMKSSWDKINHSSLKSNLNFKAS